MQPYGDIGIEKLERVGYVEKWKGTRLRALKLKMKGKKLSDKKSLDDHGRLADAEIDKLQRYYGLAIRNITDSINSMKRAIWATYFHKASIDAYPQQGHCPTNEDSWCEYNREITTRTISESECIEWFARFKSGDTSLEDNPERGWPSDFDDHALLGAMEEDKKLTTLILTENFNVN
ncbi:uncharacterized protein TNCV_3745751 [Trichonephila clavipes]|nr:uncharacterized protein TNCV_3745751 [Trichonephila clavipes]